MNAFQEFSAAQTDFNIHTKNLLEAWDGFAKEQRIFNDDIKQFYNDQTLFNEKVNKHFLI
jgi:hypothetical protein